MKTLKELQKLWYKKLADTGFVDIEESSKMQYHGSYFRERYTPDQFRAKEDYYRLASMHLESYAFVSNREYQAWALLTRVCDTYETGMLLGISHDVVGRIRKKHEKLMR